MTKIKIILAYGLFATFVLGLSGCGHKRLTDPCGTWKGKTKIDQDITMTIRRDSTIDIETEEDSVRQIQKGTYSIVDRRLRIVMKSVEIVEGDSVRTEKKSGYDEAVYTLTYSHELVLRRGLQVMVLEKVNDTP